MTSARPSAIVLYRQLAPKGIAGLLASKCVKHFGVPQVNELTGWLSFAEKAGSCAHSTRNSPDYGVHLTESGFHRTVAFDFKWRRVSELFGVCFGIIWRTTRQFVPITRLSRATSTTSTETS